MEAKLKKVKEEITKLNEDFRESPYDYSVYIKKHKSLVNKYNRIARGETFAGKIKRVLGAKVTRSKTHCSTYIYTGKNFSIELCEDACETTWWEASIWVDGVDERVHEHFNEYNNFDSKKDCAWAIYAFDCELSGVCPETGKKL